MRDTQAEAEIGVAYRDVGVFRRGHPAEPTAFESAAASGITPAELTILAYAVEVRLVTVEIRDADSNRLVAAIKIISPVNKRGRGLRDYRWKRRSMQAARVHLLEIDLLRRGARVVPGPRVPACDYLVSLTRARAGATDLWPVSLRDRLPVVPVPLRDDEDDIPLDLTTPIRDLYDAAGYDLSIDYVQPPPPPELTPEDAAWVRQVVARS